MAERIVRVVDLKKYKENLGVYRSALPSKTQIMAVIKANAYGHGVIEMAKAAAAVGAERLAVATADEAQEIIESGIRLPLHILSEKHVEKADSACILTLFSEDQIEALGKRGRPVTVHLKVETGLGRLGFFPEDVPALIEQLKKYPHIQLEGIMTHIAKSGDEASAQAQCQRLETLKNTLNLEGRLYHASNSEMALRYPKLSMDIVRVGLWSYRDVMHIETEILSLKSYPKGHSFSYESLFTSEEPIQVATLGMGYADGIPMSMHHGGRVWIKDRAYPVIGRPCMDMILVNLGQNTAGISLSDKALLKVSETAQALGENEWNMMCGFDRPRVGLRYID